ncbi:2-oxoglutarate-iron(II)-dependent oxygenase [Selaginella moellendorffii]|uniref:2-oxoglutarate-iron(II)-dependent oxygenase n=2 Tax=Selaginella moellendorffii TaxID=88036 RepID=D8QPP2_SELML|nr:2-oxoglutarate-iron(II)-dependent oxygenase [Selaginella moellendorffii]
MYKGAIKSRKKRKEKKREVFAMVAEFVPVQELGKSLKEVPKNYIAPEDKIPVVNEPGKSVPVVDLCDFDLSPEQHERVVHEIATASSEWGFFQVINHGIDVAKPQKASRDFFELPKEEKLKYAAKEYGFKSDGYGSKISNADDAVQLWRDFLFLCTSPKRNLDNWPAQPPEYKEAMSGLADDFLMLAKKVLGFLSEGVGLPTDYFEKCFGIPNQSILTNYYPGCPEPDKVLGFMPHSDFGGLTLLLQDGVPGLQVLKNNTWVVVEPIPGAITINISDLLELMSNGRYRSVIHRVQVNASRPRMSIACNYSCSFDSGVAPAPELIDEEHPQLYKPVKFGDYVQEVVKKGPTGKSYMLINHDSKPEYMLFQKH